MAVFAIPAMAQDYIAADGALGSGGVDVLGTGIFETGGEAFTYPVIVDEDVNVDSVEVGNDYAKAFGWNSCSFPWSTCKQATATNNLEIKKNQDSGTQEDGYMAKVNLERIKVGDRSATAFGNAVATNNVKIVTNQQ